jgi:hypothetical protein
MTWLGGGISGSLMPQPPPPLFDTLPPSSAAFCRSLPLSSALSRTLPHSAALSRQQPFSATLLQTHSLSAAHPAALCRTQQFAQPLSAAVSLLYDRFGYCGACGYLSPLGYCIVWHQLSCSYQPPPASLCHSLPPSAALCLYPPHSVARFRLLPPSAALCRSLPRSSPHLRSLLLFRPPSAARSRYQPQISLSWIGFGIQVREDLHRPDVPASLQHQLCCSNQLPPPFLALRRTAPSRPSSVIAAGCWLQLLLRVMMTTITVAENCLVLVRMHRFPPLFQHLS